MTHETGRLVIRGFQPDDWQDLHEYLSQDETVRFEPYGPYSVDEARREAERRSEDSAFHAVCLKDGGKVIGNVYLSPGEFDSWEIGFVFNSRFVGRGYATEACRALLQRAFAEWGAHRVVAMCNPDNVRSWRLLERLGLRREGHLRENVFFFRDDAGLPIWQDTYEYAILASELAPDAAGRVS